MKLIIERMKVRLQAWLEGRAREMEARRVKRIDREARKTIHLIEHNGVMYVGVNGVPLFAPIDLTESVIESVAQARKAYVDWMEEQAWR